MIVGVRGEIIFNMNYFDLEDRRKYKSNYENLMSCFFRRYNSFVLVGNIVYIEV